MSSIEDFGWDEYWQEVWDNKQFSEKLIPGRVVADFGKQLRIVSDAEHTAQISGKLRHELEQPELPKIGDWVAVEEFENAVIIQDILPRKTELARKIAGKTFEKQILASNIDTAFVVQSADHDFNINRLKRYLFQLKKSHIQPVVILNKIDINPNWNEKLHAAEKSFPDIKLIALSALEKNVMELLSPHLKKGETAVIIGSSGVGKSTIINSLLGENRQATKPVREDDSKGQHTTTHREMFKLESGALLIDNPGIRELQIWGSENDIGQIDSQIDELALNCKYNDCTHISEPGCAIKQALKEGTLEQTKLDTYNKMKHELELLNSKTNANEAQKYKQHQKKLHSGYRKTAKQKRVDRE